MNVFVIVHCKIIQKYLHKIIQIFSECFGNNSLIYWKSIFNSKWHHLPYKSLIVCNKCNLVSIFWSYKNVMYPKYPSKKEYVSCLIIVFKTSCVKGEWYGSFFVVAFYFWNLYIFLVYHSSSVLPLYVTTI